MLANPDHLSKLVSGFGMGDLRVMKWGGGDDFEVSSFYVGCQEIVCFDEKRQAGGNTSLLI